MLPSIKNRINKSIAWLLIQNMLVKKYLTILLITIILVFIILYTYFILLNFYNRSIMIASIPVLQILVAEIVMLRMKNLTKDIKFKIRALNFLLFLLFTVKPLISFEILKPGWEDSYSNEYHTFSFSEIVSNPSIDDYLALIIIPFWLLIIFLIKKLSIYFLRLSYKIQGALFLFSLWLIVIFVLRNILLNPIISDTIAKMYFTNSDETFNFSYYEFLDSFNPVTTTFYAFGNFLFCALPSIALVFIIHIIKKRSVRNTTT